MFFSTRGALPASFALASLLLCPGPALADDDETNGDSAAQSEEIQVATIMVTATRVLTDLFEVPITVNVLTEEDLRKNPKVDLGEILSDIPGVSVEAPGGPGTARVSIRGEHTGRTLLMVDGMRMTSQASSAALTTFLMTDASNIERIEVIKGPASVLYGSEAIGGVVNIITKKGGGGKPIGFDSSVLVDTSTLSVSFRGAVFGEQNGISYRAFGSNTSSGAVKRADGTRVHGTDFDMTQYGGQLGYRWDSGNFFLQATRYEGSMKMVADNWERFQWPINDRDSLNGAIVFDDVSEYLKKLTINASAQNAERMWYSPASDVYSDQNNYSLSVQSDWVFGKHSVIAGLEYDFDDVKSTTRRNSLTAVKYKVNGEQTKISPFLQDEWKITDDWTATFGVRGTFLEAKRGDGTLFSSARDKNPKKRQRTSGVVGSFGLTYTGIDDWALRASWNQGRRDPLLSHLMIGSSGMGMQTYLPNPDLKPETSNNFEVGARYRGGGWDVDWAVYYNEAKNFFDTKQLGTFLYQFVNQDKATTLGSELSVAYTFDQWNLTPYSNFNWIYRRTTQDGVTSSRTQYGTPRFRGKTGLKWHTDPSARNWTFFADGYVDWASKGYRLDDSDRPAWQDVSFNFGLEGGEALRYNLTLGIRNIFNQDFSGSKGGTNSAGRHYVIGLGIKY